MQLSDRTRNLSALYERQKHSILGVLTKASTPAPKKASVMISISKICAISAEILEEMRNGALSETELLEAERIHRAWQDLLVTAWEKTVAQGIRAA